jgi:aspartate/methionine/tyrosine aminotransferase
MTVSSARRVASRMQTIGTEGAFAVSARARALEAQGRPMIHLQIGEPDFDTPAHVREAAKRALDAGATHYAPFPGIPELRKAIADDVTKRKGFPADPSQVFVTVGGKGVMLYAILGLVDPGDEVIVPDPTTDHQLAGQPDRRGADPSRPRADRRARRRARPVGHDR